MTLRERGHLECLQLKEKLLVEHGLLLFLLLVLVVQLLVVLRVHGHVQALGSFARHYFVNSHLAILRLAAGPELGEDLVLLPDDLLELGLRLAHASAALGARPRPRPAPRAQGSRVQDALQGELVLLEVRLDLAQLVVLGSHFHAEGLGPLVQAVRERVLSQSVLQIPERLDDPNQALASDVVAQPQKLGIVLYLDVSDEFHFCLDYLHFFFDVVDLLTVDLFELV